MNQVDLDGLGLPYMPRAKVAISADIWLQVRGFIDLANIAFEPQELASAVHAFAEQSITRRLSDVISTDEFSEVVQASNDGDLIRRIPFLMHTAMLERAQAVAQMWRQFGPNGNDSGRLPFGRADGS